MPFVENAWRVAHPRKNSRLITVGSQRFRWHVDINDDYPWEKVVSVFPAEAPNGARLAMTLVEKTILPSVVRRLILVGMRLGYEPHDRTKSLVVPAEHLAEISQDFPRLIRHHGIDYTWTPESRGGLHVKVRRADAPDGQLLATFTSLLPEHLNELFVSKVIDVALDQGWEPEALCRDCHWLEARTCSRIIDELESQRPIEGV